MKEPDTRSMAEEFFGESLAQGPIGASFLGYREYDAEVPDPSAEAEAGRQEWRRGFLDRLDRISPDAVTDPEDRITRSMLRRRVVDDIAASEAALEDVSASATIAGPQTSLLSSLPNLGLPDAEASEAYLERLAKIPAVLDAHLERYRSADAEGRRQTRVGAASVAAQIRGYLGSEEEVFLGAKPEGVDADRWRERGERICRDAVRPAFERWLTAFENDLAVRARGGEEAGVCHVPGGAEGYEKAVARHTTTDMTAEEVHGIGLERVALLREEFSALGLKAFGTSDVGAITGLLRDREDLRYQSSDEILSDALDNLSRAEAALPDWFHSYDFAPCTVKPIPAAVAADSTLAYYQPPSIDGSRPGTHFVNVHEPRSRTRFEYEALAFHESVPGHHLQFALGQRLDGLPRFRRHGYITVFGEGWGLYTERLADEMGLYSGDLARLGMVSFDAWRACRLVVDTGLHAEGWSRDEAIAFMEANTALSRSNIVNEVDRYIAWPGQALAYMVGRLHIDRLRADAERELGSGFDVRAFHHEVLGHGSVPLPALSEIIGDWVAEGGPSRWEG